MIARTVFDTSTLVSAALRRRSVPYQALQVAILSRSLDDQILALCLAIGADVLVSSDHDLLVLHPWNGIPILTPAHFLSQSET